MKGKRLASKMMSNAFERFHKAKLLKIADEWGMDEKFFKG